MPLDASPWPCACISCQSSRPAGSHLHEIHLVWSDALRPAPVAHIHLQAAVPAASASHCACSTSRSSFASIPMTLSHSTLPAGPANHRLLHSGHLHGHPPVQPDALRPHQLGTHPGGAQCAGQLCFHDARHLHCGRLLHAPATPLSGQASEGSQCAGRRQGESLTGVWRLPASWSALPACCVATWICIQRRPACRQGGSVCSRYPGMSAQSSRWYAAPS